MRRGRLMVGLSALFAVAIALSGCWFLPITLDEAADGSARSVEVGDTIDIRLTGNASTGYQWIRIEPESFEGTPLEAIEEGEYKLEDPEVCGGPGVFTSRYRAVAPGTITLGFAYQRPWEEESIDEFSVIIWVQ
ncbi:MAG: protease inhibitor I42 family protein [Candidatus Bipolaricaulia bacterium]